MSNVEERSLVDFTSQMSVGVRVSGVPCMGGRCSSSISCPQAIDCDSASILSYGSVVGGIAAAAWERFCFGMRLAYVS